MGTRSRTALSTEMAQKKCKIGMYVLSRKFGKAFHKVGTLSNIIQHSTQEGMFKSKSFVSLTNLKVVNKSHYYIMYNLMGYFHISDKINRNGCRITCSNPISNLMGTGGNTYFIGLEICILPGNSDIVMDLDTCGKEGYTENTILSIDVHRTLMDNR